MPDGTVLLIGTLDTKGEEYAYVRDLIRANGLEVLIMDCGVLGDPAAGLEPDVDAARVARAGGETLESLRAREDRGYAMDVMTEGVCAETVRLYGKGAIDGVLALGGGGGTAVATAAMRELPVGIPKVMVSTVASGDVEPYVGVKDVTMMYSVVDIAGLNALSREILGNAAGAISGMVSQSIAESTFKSGSETASGSASEAGSDSGASSGGREKPRPLLAATMFGVTTPCVQTVRDHLEEAGYELLVFHATGTGGRAMEGLIDDGYIEGVADVTTTEWCDEVVGGILSAGPHRLEAAGKAGIPQVVSCGALDMVNFAHIDTVPERFADRRLHKHNENVTLMRTEPEECREIGRRIAEKLSAATGPVTLMLPLKGVSAIDREDQPFYHPQADEALFDALRSNCSDAVEVVEIDAHINDPAFGKALAERLLEQLADGSHGG